MPLWTGQPLAYPTVQKTGAAALGSIHVQGGVAPAGGGNGMRSDGEIGKEGNPSATTILKSQVEWLSNTQQAYERQQQRVSGPSWERASPLFSLPLAVASE